MPITEKQLDLLAEEKTITGETPADLIFDDEPLDPLLYGTTPVEPTPASALELWKRNLDRSPACARAIAITVARNPEGLSATDREVAEECLRLTIAANPPVEELQLAHCYAGLAYISTVKKNMAEVECCLRQALKLFEATLGLRNEQTHEIGKDLIRLLNETKREDQAETMAIRLELGFVEGKHDEYSLYLHRRLALKMFVAGQYTQAETAYRYLIEKGFETPTNHCHLARVLLMKDRVEEACREVNRAWDTHETGPDYVIPRIFYLKALTQMLARADWHKPLTDLKRALAEPGKESEWILQPVLDHFKPQLKPALYEFMTKLLAAISDRAKLPELAACKIWKNIIVERKLRPPPDAKPTV